MHSNNRSINYIVDKVLDAIVGIYSALSSNQDKVLTLVVLKLDGLLLSQIFIVDYDAINAVFSINAATRTPFHQMLVIIGNCFLIWPTRQINSGMLLRVSYQEDLGWKSLSQ